MKEQDAIELADRFARRRPLGFALAALSFLIVQIIVRPVFRSDGYAASGWRAYAWVVNAVLLLCMLLPLGGAFWGARVRALVNDDVARMHARAATTVGFWLAMILALGMYVLPATQGFTAREAIFLIVTPATGTTVLTFAWLEARANRDD